MLFFWVQLRKLEQINRALSAKTYANGLIELISPFWLRDFHIKHLCIRNSQSGMREKSPISTTDGSKEKRSLRFLSGKKLS
ncbi:hypothetical protein C8N25_1366 [Algoriphagus antarcticus]|uniref:Uncharacterized protein n=1 Tax=Algoriphagus antarcticus TaxID=238540 RepID=A0A3E0D745_9BACT|nr:hypothetical protein C8N25_1366 [Algoriphagus antarcticus]